MKRSPLVRQTCPLKKKEKVCAIPKELPPKPKRKPTRDRKSLVGIQAKEERGENLRPVEIRKLALYEWAKLVKLNVDGVCEWCGNPAVHAHHMVAKAQGEVLKFAPENGVALCYLCHVTFHQKDSLTGWLLFEEQRPVSYAFVMEHRNETVKWQADDYRLILDDLRRQVKEFGE